MQSGLILITETRQFGIFVMVLLIAVLGVFTDHVKPNVVRESRDHGLRGQYDSDINIKVTGNHEF